MQRFDYSYDTANRRTGVTEANGDVVTWTLDDAGRLTREQRSGTNAYDITYTMDGVGRHCRSSGLRRSPRHSRRDSASDGPTHAFGWTRAEPTPHACADANRLATQELPGGEVSTMVYAATGLRASRQVGATTTDFVWDGQKVLQEVGSAPIWRDSEMARFVGYRAGGFVT
ncbi:MAG: hypothetical protein GF320_22115 [Armatimonadia bacterium]|nr:hypothetical protein [Armatimonadia bacterium]